MQGKDLKLKSRRSDDFQQQDEQHPTKREDYHPMPRMRRGDGSKSSPVTSTSLLKPLMLNQRSQSEGNLIAAQTFDLKNHREVTEVQNDKQTLYLPKLRQDTSPRSSLLTDSSELKKKTVSKPVMNVSRGTLRPLVLNNNERRRIFQMHMEREENSYEAGTAKRESLLRWLSDQNVSATSN